MEYSTNFEPGSYQSACETYINFIDFIDEMDSYIATEADGGDKIPWYKKLLTAISELVERVQNKIKMFIIDFLEKQGQTYTLTDDAIRMIDKMLRGVRTNEALLKNVNFKNESEVTMITNKVKKAKSAIEEEINNVLDKEAIKKGKEALKNADISRKTDDNKYLSDIRTKVSIALIELKKTAMSITSKAETYGEKEKSAATSACSACIELISLIDKYVPLIIVKCAVRTSKVGTNKENAKQEGAPATT